MAPAQTAHVLLSPVELSYLHTSLSLNPPIRPDARSPTEFRPLVAETDILPAANGSARICFADGTEAVAGIKAEVEKSQWRPSTVEHGVHLGTASGDIDSDEGNVVPAVGKGKGDNSWVEMSIEIPGFRDDDALPVFLAAMLTEALLSSGELKDRLYINRRFHWKLYIDILLLSPPLSYPLPLLSLTTHLALLASRLPALKSEGDEDPLFDDDWAAAVPLYSEQSRPPVTLLVVTVGSNIIFDPSKEELAVAEGVLALSVGGSSTYSAEPATRALTLLSVRTIDPPSRLTSPGVPNILNTATGGSAPVAAQEALMLQEAMEAQGIWRPPRGGVKRNLVGRALKLATEKGGVAEEVLMALKNVKS